MKLIRYVVALSIVVASLLTVQPALSGDGEITDYQAYTIARIRAKDLGYKPRSMGVEVTRYGKQEPSINRTLQIHESQAHFGGDNSHIVFLRAKLNNREYWGVRFEPELFFRYHLLLGSIHFVRVVVW